MTARALVLALAAASAWPGGAARAEDPPRRLGLRDALAAAVRGNPRIVAASIDLDVAEDRVAEARGARGAVLTLTAGGTVARTDPVPGEIFQRLATDAVTVGGVVKQPLDDGSTLSVGFDQGVTRQTSRLESNGSREDATDTVFAPIVKLGLVHPFLRGAGAEAALAGPHRAAVACDAAALEREAIATDVVRQVIQAYWEVVAARRELDIQRASVALARDQLHVVRVAVAAGTVPADAAVEVEAALALREENELVAEGALVERSLELRRLAGLELGPGELTIEPTETIPAAPAAEADASPDAAVARALAQNARLLALRARARGATIDVDVAEDAARPQLDLALSASASGNAATAGDAFNHLASYGGLRVDASVTYSAPLPSEGPRATRSAARRALARARIDVADLEAQTTVAVVRAANKVRLARKRIETLAKSAELAEVNLRGEQQRWQAGQSRTFDVLRRQSELAEARLRSSRAHIDHQEALADLQALTGDLMTAHGVTLK